VKCSGPVPATAVFLGRTWNMTDAEGDTSGKKGTQENRGQDIYQGIYFGLEEGVLL